MLFDQELSFGTATKRIEIVGRSGAPISLDKSGRISPTFDTRSAADVEPLLNAIRTVLDAIGSAGIEAFLAYGTLLGADPREALPRPRLRRRPRLRQRVQQPV